MAERGILFSASMVRALLAGRKTQTRRLINFKHGVPQTYLGQNGQGDFVFTATTTWGGQWRSPHAVGDRLWVRESFSYAEYLADTVWYWADGNFAAFDCSKPKPSIHMPRWASRSMPAPMTM